METNELRKAAEMALEALEDVPLKPTEWSPAVEALRQALAQPVLYMDSKQMPEGMPDWKPGMIFPKPKRDCDNCESLRRAAWDRINELENELAEERESCAKVCETFYNHEAKDCAEAIRARGEK